MVIRIGAFFIIALASVYAGSIGAFAQEDITPVVETRMERNPQETRLLMERKRQATSEMKLNREEMKKKAEELRNTMEQKREEAQEKFQARREEFKKKIETIKDERKRTALEDIDLRINELNTQHTARLENVLSKVTDILGRIEEKVASQEAEGIDTAEVDTAIATAHTIIDGATTAITTQAGKQYIIDITDETSIREEVLQTFTTFKADITAVHAKVKAAREAVVQVARLYGQLNKQKNITIAPSVNL